MACDSLLVVRRVTGAILLLGILFSGWLPAGFGADGKPEPRRKGAKATNANRPEGPTDYRSKNFIVHTDLDAEEAEDLLIRLETMLSLVSQYFGRPNTQPIECYVVEDLSKWPADAIDPTGLASIRDGAGVTLSRITVAGARWHGKATVYAVADRGTPQHEAVHAYCAQTFGRTGPVWYSEGMAEVGNYWREGDKSVLIPDPVLDYLKASEPKSLNDIVNGKEFTGDSWQNYAWRWALCHLLGNNTNYQARFRPLGLGLLTGANVSFEQVYGSMAPEISFEYLFFLEHLEQGFRADLCSWDWKTRSKRPRGRTPLVSKINAARGWQPSRASVEAGYDYEYETTGMWKTSADAEDLTADGDAEGKGKLVGVIFKDYELSEPFELGASGTFTAPSNGDLLLRCQDGWGELADNSGEITVRIQEKGREGTATTRTTK